MTLEQSVRTLAERDDGFAKLIDKHRKDYDEILPTVLFDDLGAAAWQAYKQGEPEK